jgi:hypothetical protein
MISLEAPVNEPLPSLTSQQQTGNAGRHSADAPQLPESKGDPSSCHDRMRTEHPSTPNNRKPPQRADRFKTPSPLRWSYQLIGTTILAPLAASHPLSLSEIASRAMEADGAQLEQLFNPHTWALGLCFVMLLVGLVWAALVHSRTWSTQLCRHCLQASGFFSLVLGVAWTAILHSVDANDNRRYLALGVWSTFTIAFVSECIHDVQHPQHYSFLVVPAFLMALHVIQLLTQQIDSPVTQSWDVRRFYENVPVVFTLYAMVLYCLSTKSSPNDRIREEPAEGTELQDRSIGGDGVGNIPGGLSSQEVEDGE